MLLEWIKARAAGPDGEQEPPQAGPRQATLWTSAPYQEDAPAIRSEAELAGAIEHLQYAVFRRYENQLTRAERARLDNTIENALFKIGRYAERLEGACRDRVDEECRAARDAAREGRERAERLRRQAQRADLKLAQLGSLTPEGFEEFVAEVFEALGYAVERVGSSGD
jgi:restriction system protein